MQSEIPASSPLLRYSNALERRLGHPIPSRGERGDESREMLVPDTVLTYTKSQHSDYYKLTGNLGRDQFRLEVGADDGGPYYRLETHPRNEPFSGTFERCGTLHIQQPKEGTQWIIDSLERIADLLEAEPSLSNRLKVRLVEGLRALMRSK